MKTRVLAGLGLASVVLAACGGGGGGTQDEVADMVIEQMADDDIEMDEDCVRDAAGDLSDDDAQKILDAGPDGEPEDLSPEAEAAAATLAGCINTDALVDQVVDDMVGSMGEDSVDADCLKEALADLDVATFDEEDPAFVSAMLECVDLGG